jgi:hypothetical protein
MRWESRKKLNDESATFKYPPSITCHLNGMTVIVKVKLDGAQLLEQLWTVQSLIRMCNKRLVDASKNGSATCLLLTLSLYDSNVRSPVVNIVETRDDSG